MSAVPVRACGRVPAAAGLLCAVVGALDVVSAVTRADHRRFRALVQLVPVSLTAVSAAGTLVAGLLLLMLARGLRRRKRRAWWAVLVVLAVSAVTNLLKGLDVEEAAAATALLVGLLLRRGDFQAQGDPRSRWRALAALGGLLLSDLLVGSVLLVLRRHALLSPLTASRALSGIGHGLVGLPGPLVWRPGPMGDHASDVVTTALLGLGLLTAVLPVYLALRPARPVARLDASDERAVRDLLARHGGRDSLGYFALRRDKSVLWSPTHKACLSYRVVAGVALVSGDPLGDPEAWPGAIRALLDLAAQHAWVPAVSGCSEQAAAVWVRHGMSVLELGDEAVLDVATFTLQGRPMRGVRQAVARCERAGYCTQVLRTGNLDEATRAELQQAATRWRGSETERGFSMALGRLGELSDPQCVVVLGRQHGQLRGFLHFVPWGPDGLSLDLMRRDRDAENGINELLVSSAVAAAPQLGVHRLSLNFAVFRSTLERGERIGAGPLIRAIRAVLLFASRWYQIESLYRFNAKFRPTWEPRYVCYPTARDLPRVALAALEAEAFLVWPQWHRPRRDRAADPRRTAAGTQHSPALAGSPHPADSSGPPMDHRSEAAGSQPPRAATRRAG